MLPPSSPKLAAKIHNERVKLTANALNGGSISAIWSFGAAGVLKATEVIPDLSFWRISGLMIAPLLIALVLHMAARTVLRRLVEEE